MFLKNITISIIIFFLGAGSVFADLATDLVNGKKDPIINLGNGETSLGSDETSSLERTIERDKASNMNFNEKVQSDSAAFEKEHGFSPDSSNSTKSSSTQFNCTPGKDSLCSEQFKIDTSKFSPGGKGLNKTSSKATINGFMTTLIKKLMVALGSLALIVMVVGAGFMIMSMGKDEDLNKGKTIFKAGIIALAIALSSYFMVSFLSYILYSI